MSQGLRSRRGCGPSDRTVSELRNGEGQPMTTRTMVGLRRRGLWLEYLTIAWNVVEAVIAVAAGLAASSIALVGFGFDSTIEVAAAAVVVWQFRSEMRGGVDENDEHRALRVIAVTFFVLAAYVM